MVLKFDEPKQSNGPVEEVEANFRALAHASPDAVITIDENGKILFVNDAAERIFGHSVSEMTGAPLMMLVPDYLRNSYEPQFKRYLESPQQHAIPKRVECIGLHRSGRAISLELSFGEFTKGGKRCFTGLVRDTTGRQHVEALLASTEARFQTIFENTLDAILIVDDEMNYVDANATACELFGYSREEILKRKAGDFTELSLLPSVEKRWPEFLERGQMRGEFRLYRQDGGLREIEYFAKANFLPGLHLSILRDITERKRAEEEIRKLASIVENSPNFIGIATLEGRVLFVNPAGQSLVGLENSEQTQATQVLDYVAEQERERFRNQVLPAVFREGHWEGETLFRHFKSGAVIPMLQHIFFITEHGTEHRMALATICLDNTKHQQAEEALRIAQAELEKQVEERTLELSVANTRLRAEVEEHAEAEAALRRAEENYHSIFENAVEGIFQSTPEGKFISVNPAYARMMGYESPEELIETLTDIDHQHYVLPGRRAEFKRLIATRGVIQGFESEAYRKDGGTVWISENVRGVRSKDGKLLYYEGTVEDISERRRAEEALRKSEEHLRLLVGGIKDYAIFMLDTEGHIASWNEGATRLKGYLPEEIIGQHFSVCFGPEDVAQCRPDHVLKIAAAQGRFEDECLLMRKDGSQFWAHLIITALRDEEGNLRGFAEITRDITERKQANEALRESEARNRAILKALPDLIFLLSNEGVYLDYYAKGTDDLLVSPEEFLGKSVEEVLPPELAHKVMGCLQEITEASEPRLLEYQLPINGEIRHYEGRIVRCSNEEILYVVRNISHRKRGEEQRLLLMRRIATAQEEERYRIARELHDQIGQYLAALMLRVKSLKDESHAAPRLANDVTTLQELINEFSHEMRRLALDLRPLALEDFGLSTALSNYLEQWSKRSGIAADFHSNGLLNKRFPSFIETALYRVIQEALNNVLKHSQAQHVSLVLEYRHGRLLVILEDDGRGFDIEAVTSTPVAKRGLGLIGMRERVESVGGTLEIESSPNAGTTLAARIPVIGTDVTESA